MNASHHRTGFDRGTHVLEEVGQPSYCRPDYFQVASSQPLPRYAGETVSINTAGQFEEKGGNARMDHVWDRVTALYLRAMNELDEQHGQGLVEYALIIAVVGVMLVGALVALRGGIGNTFSNIQTSLSTNGG